MLTGNLTEKNPIQFQDNQVSFPPERPTNYWSIAKKAAVRIVCPPILLWDGLKWGVNKLAGGAMAKLILPAASDLEFAKLLADYKGEAQLKENIEKKLKKLSDKDFPNKNNLVFQPLTIHTEDEAKLNALEFSYFEIRKYKKSEKYIINFLGNGECYEHPNNIEQMLKDAMRYQCNVIGFNYRGVNDSLGKPKNSKKNNNEKPEYLKPTSTQELVNDGLALVQSLLSKGIKPENIILNGHSLGAGIASIVGDYCHRHGIPVRVINGRSFSTVTRVAVGHIRAAGKNPQDKHSFTAILKKNVFKILGYLAMPFVKLGLALTKWEIDAASAFKRIPSTHKDYWLVRSDKAARNADPGTYDIPIDDTVIPHWSSLHRDSELREDRRESKKCTTKIIKYLHKQIEIEKKNNSNMVPIYEEAIDRAIDNEKRAINTRKMIVNDKSEEGHWAKNHELTSRYRETDPYGIPYLQSANDFFENFFNRSLKSKSPDYSKKNTEHSSENLSQVNLVSSTDEGSSYDPF